MCWLDFILESKSILSAILAVTHPELYDLGRETLKCVRGKVPEPPHWDVLNQWTSVFNIAAVITHRETPPHWDGNSMHHWYNLLVTLGWCQECNLNLLGLRISLENSPGMAVGLSGMVLEHEVSDFECAMHTSCGTVSMSGQRFDQELG